MAAWQLTSAVGRRRSAHATASWALLMASAVSGVAEGLKGTEAQQTKGSGAHGPGSRPRNERERLALAPAMGATVGCWFGAWPMPLDWDKPWQACNTPQTQLVFPYIRLWRRSAVEQSSGRVPGRAVEMPSIGHFVHDKRIPEEVLPHLIDTSKSYAKKEEIEWVWSRRARQRCPSQNRHKTRNNHQPGGRRARGGSGGGGSDGWTFGSVAEIRDPKIMLSRNAIRVAACDCAQLAAERGVSQIPEAFLLIEHGSHRARNETWDAAATQAHLAHASAHAAALAAGGVAKLTAEARSISSQRELLVLLLLLDSQGRGLPSSQAAEVQRGRGGGDGRQPDRG
eukprot:SM000058S18544  [mRNA]  locus=s58:444481:453519:- [translate_table: standard]